MNTVKLKQMILENVKPADYYREIFGDSYIHNPHGETNVWCPFHDDEGSAHKSMSISKNGEFYCHSGHCGVSGTTVIQFNEKYKKLSFVNSMLDIYSNFVTKTISASVVEGFHANLLHSPKVLNWLKTARGINKQSVERFELGFDNKRITIPIYDEFDLCVNIRRYDWTKTQAVKMLPYEKGYGSKRLFPVENLLSRQIVLCEGEMDAIVTAQMGFPALTSTAGVGSWNNEWNELLRNHDVIICFDVNDYTDAGQKCARKRAALLSGIAQQIKIVKLPLQEIGGDLTDYFAVHKHTANDFQQLIDTAQIVELNNAEIQKTLKDDKDYEHEVTLNEASLAVFCNKKIKMKCLVSGKDLAPFLPPSLVHICCKDDRGLETCLHCPLAAKNYEMDYRLDDDPKEVLQFINCNDSALKATIRGRAGIPKTCKVSFQTKESFNVERIQMTPEVDHAVIQAYSSVTGYHIGHGILSNRAYEFKGFTVPEPKSQLATHILTSAEPTQSSIDAFEITPDVVKELKIFRPTEGQTVQKKLDDIYEHHAHNATRIFERPLLHQAIDLVFHSVLSFKFNGERVMKGYLDVLVLGDTRTGKGYVAEGLVRYYNLGEIVGGENATFAGLVGGMQQFSDRRWAITWGKIPLNDRRLLIVDEASSLTLSDWERLSRVRSEGIAEITKIQTERTTARTRLLWLANPRSGQPMNTYTTGVEAIVELVGKTEDVARFDYAVAVATDEVDSSVINSLFRKPEKTPYTSELCRKLILWCWSRKLEQILFASDAKIAILEAAQAMARKYTSVIPLMQTENARVKIARTAVAVAVRVFSCIESGEKVFVDKCHVDAAVNFINELYTKTCLSYESFSRTVLDRKTLKRPSELNKLFDSLEKQALDFVEGCLEHESITVMDISDYAGVDKDRAKAIAGTLVQQRAIIKNHIGYRKKPSFIEYLKQRREHYLKHGLPRNTFSE
jgi:hypothetical protein